METLAAAPFGARSREIGAALWRLADARTRTVTRLQDVPVAWHSRAATHGANTIASILYHLAAIELDYTFVEVLRADFPAEARVRFPFDVREESGRLTAVNDELAAGNVARLAWVRELLLSAFRHMSLAEFRATRLVGSRYVSPEWVLHHLAQHEAEHRGEIESLLTEFRSLDAEQ